MKYWTIMRSASGCKVPMIGQANPHFVTKCCLINDSVEAVGSESERAGLHQLTSLKRRSQ